jgi:hypothetical protein
MQKILTTMVEQFKARHHHQPEQIVLHPLALVALSARRSVAPIWNGIPVVCGEVEPKKVAGVATRLGIHVAVEEEGKEAVLEAFDLP